MKRMTADDLHRKWMKTPEYQQEYAALAEEFSLTGAFWQNVPMKVLNIGDLKSPGVYQEFLRVHSMSLGLYRHEAGASVPQQPHSEDEVYFVISGHGMIAIDGVDFAVTNGSVAYVPAGVAHHFHSVTEPLQVLVAFAPAEGSLVANLKTPSD